MEKLTVTEITSTNGLTARPEHFTTSSPWWSVKEHRVTLPADRAVGGVWEAESGWAYIKDWPYHQVCVILSGRIAVESLDGERSEFGEGRAFLIPKGFNGYLYVLEPVRKVFVGVFDE
ncbi:cupin domain-containing protein [Leifsonia shinshuensis]|uniref:Cupin domain-containing protein n=1 Tax=Leifsonia shinshuensis TaxID=150026 RepID=A0A7G6YA38_9MICO|nr:cupin domain-containing protein [Leifsonia shinshuensis]QNE35353.1 cupin domain-containing protein [Leifsonia shinshuensis]